MRTSVVVTSLAAALLIGACSTTLRGRRDLRVPAGSWNVLEARDARAERDKPVQEPQAESKPAPKKEEEEPSEGRSLVHVLLLYIPNRLLDIFDIARAGVDVGPGIGIDLTATEYLRLGLLTRISAGLGYETLRHMPIKAGAESEFGFGPIGADSGYPLSWYRNTWDFRVELHVLIVGAHVAVNPMEIADAIVGFTTIDIMGDDY